MVETNYVAAEKPDGRQSVVEKRDSNYMVFVQNDEPLTSCFCLDRWENEGGAVIKNTITTTR